MASKSALDAHRLNAFSFDPDDLYIVTDKDDPLYDSREALPLQEPMVLSVMRRGVVKAILARKLADGRAMVLDGRQRVKCAREANHRFKANGDERRVMVPVFLRRGDAADAFACTVVANEFAQVDPVREKAAKAQRLAQLGHTEGSIAVDMGVDVSTVKRWLDIDVAKKAAPKRRGKATRPGVSLLKRALKANTEDEMLGPREHMLLSMAAGETTLEALLEEFPELEALFKATA